MIINKKEIAEIEKILASFGHVPKKSFQESKQVQLPKRLLSYLENKAKGRIQVSPPVKNKYVEFYVEYYENVFILVRKLLSDNRETRVVLLPEELELIKDPANIKLRDVKALVKKVNDKEKRFGL